MTLTEKIQKIPEIAVLLEMLKLSQMDTYNHSISVSKITEKMLSFLPYPEEEKEEIIKGALLHDIGKLFVPFNLTQLPRSLSLQEFSIIQIHAAVSYEIIHSVFSKIVQDICLFHHERPNGSGYSQKIMLCDIPEYALLVQVADVYDALTEKRNYKQPYSSEKAIQIMKSDASQFLLDDQFVNLLEKALEG